ncbi:MAG: methenyltetrahydromethanopterin cyclohydrolase [Candidatus Bathyarchaeia archaeon]
MSWKPRWAEKLSVNKIGYEIVKGMIKNCDRLNIAIDELKNGTTVLDCGVNVPGGYRAGELAAKLRMGGLGEVHVSSVTYGDVSLPTAILCTDFPAMIGLCAYVWYGIVPQPFDTKAEFSAWISGPGRVLAQAPQKVFDKVYYRDESDVSVLVVQSRKLPNEKIADYLAERCGVSPKNLYLVVTPTESVAGSVQVVAVSGLEDTFWRLTEFYGIPYARIKQALGSTPIPPVHQKIFEIPCITPDDAIRYGGIVHYWVESVDGEDLEAIVRGMVIENYPINYGKSYYQIGGHPPDLHTFAKEGRGFVVGEAGIYDTRTGKMYKAGRVHIEMIKMLLRNPW